MRRVHEDAALGRRNGPWRYIRMRHLGTLVHRQDCRVLLEGAGHLQRAVHSRHDVGHEYQA